METRRKTRLFCSAAGAAVQHICWITFLLTDIITDIKKKSYLKGSEAGPPLCCHSPLSALTSHRPPLNRLRPSEQTVLWGHAGLVEISSIGNIKCQHIYELLPPGMDRTDVCDWQPGSHCAGCHACLCVCASQHCVLIASARVGWLHRQSARRSASSVCTWMTDCAWCLMAVLTTAQPIKSNIGGPPGMLPLVTPFTYRFNFSVNLTRKKHMCSIVTCTCMTELSIKSKFEAGNSIFFLLFLATWCPQNVLFWHFVSWVSEYGCN